MTDNSDLELHDLLDLVVKHNSEYTRMLLQGILTAEEFAQCKQTLAELQNATDANHSLGMKMILPEEKRNRIVRTRLGSILTQPFETLQ